MALNSSGAISIAGSTTGQSIALEFNRGATSSLSLSQLYRGGGIVPNATANNAVPTSGAISLSNFYGAKNRVAVTITLATTTDYVLNTAAISGYTAGVTDVTVNIPSGVYVYGTTTGPAFKVDTLASGDTVVINNSGNILGKGGDGNSGNGGPAFDASPTSASVTLNNNSGAVISGGGGGGGGGRAAHGDYASGYSYVTWHNYSGGGGGGSGSVITSPAQTAGYGASGATRGVGRTGGPVNYYRSASNGGIGTYNSPGSGGLGDFGHTVAVSPNYYTTAGPGGAGGGRGANGAGGGEAYYSGDDIGSMVVPTSGSWWIYTNNGTDYAAGAGGSAGNGIKGLNKVSLTNNGSIYGPQVN